MMRPVIWTVVILLSIAVMLGTLAIAWGVCRFDDASFAVVSRSIAEGRGYKITLNYNGNDFRPQLFPPALGEGPVSILPVALAIYLFGVQPWVPGLTHVLIAVTLLAGFTALAVRSGASSRAPSLLLLFWVLVFFMSSRHFGYWFTQIGEPIAALFVLCGYAAWVMESRRVMAAALSGFFLGFAVLTKEMAGLYVMSIVTAVFVARVLELRNRPLNVGDARTAMALVACGTLPFLMFELWRLGTLGPGGWLQNWEAHVAFIREQSNSAHRLANLGRLLTERTNTIREQFFPSVLLIIGLVGASLALANRYGTQSVRRLALFLGWGTAVHVVYWMFLSNGWPRYLYMAVILWCALIALPILAHPPRRVVLGYLAMLAVVPMSGLPDLPVFWTIWSVATGRAAQANAHEHEVLAYLDREAPSEVVYTSWWAHVASLEYLSHRPGRFQGGASKVLEGEHGSVHVIVHQDLLGFQNEQDVELLSRLSRCGTPVLIRGPFNVFRCRISDNHSMPR